MKRKRHKFRQSEADEPKPYIVHTPDTCGGQARLYGHRLTVHVIYSAYRECFRKWKNHDEAVMAVINEHYSHLTRAKVEVALEYAEKHKDEIRQYASYRCHARHIDSR